jgi:hypothetical protein
MKTYTDLNQSKKLAEILHSIRLLMVITEAQVAVGMI